MAALVPVAQAVQPQAEILTPYQKNVLKIAMAAISIIGFVFSVSLLITNPGLIAFSIATISSFGCGLSVYDVYSNVLR